MKTVNTALGIRTIEEEDKNLVAAQLRTLIQEQRSVLIDDLINSDLNRYLDYKFNMKMEPVLLNRIHDTLLDLKQSGVSLVKYEAMLEAIDKFDFIELSNELFYDEIEERIRHVISQTELFQTAESSPH